MDAAAGPRGAGGTRPNPPTSYDELNDDTTLVNTIETLLHDGFLQVEKQTTVHIDHKWIFTGNLLQPGIYITRTNAHPTRTSGAE